MPKLMIKGEQVSGTQGDAMNVALNNITGMSSENVQEGIQELKEGLDTTNNSFTNLETTVNNLSGRLTYLTSNTVGSPITIKNWSTYAKKHIEFVLASGNTHCASMPYTSTSNDIRLNYNDGTNHIAKVSINVSNDVATVSTENISNASGWTIIIYTSN